MPKSSFSFDKRATEFLESIAERRGLSKAEVIRRAIMVYDYFVDIAGPSQRLRLTFENGKTIVLLVP